MKGKPGSVNHPAYCAEAPFTFRKPECIDVIQYLPFATGNAVKYVWRAGLKSADCNEDLDKALWYLKAYSFGADQGFACYLADLLVPADAKDEVAALKLDIIRAICAGGRPLDKMEKLRALLAEGNRRGRKANTKHKP